MRRVDRTGLAVADRLDPRGSDALRNQVLLDDVGAGEPELHVRRGGTTFVGVAGDTDLDRSVGLHDINLGVEHRLLLGTEDRRGGNRCGQRVADNGDSGGLSATLSFQRSGSGLGTANSRDAVSGLLLSSGTGRRFSHTLRFCFASGNHRTTLVFRLGGSFSRCLRCSLSGKLLSTQPSRDDLGGRTSDWRRRDRVQAERKADAEREAHAGLLDAARLLDKPVVRRAGDVSNRRGENERQILERHERQAEVQILAGPIGNDRHAIRGTQGDRREHAHAILAAVEIAGALERAGTDTARPGQRLERLERRAIELPDVRNNAVDAGLVVRGGTKLDSLVTEGSAPVVGENLVRLEAQAHTIANAAADAGQCVQGDFQANRLAGVAETEAHRGAAVSVARCAVAHCGLRTEADERVVPVCAEGDWRSGAGARRAAWESALLSSEPNLGNRQHELRPQRISALRLQRRGERDDREQEARRERPNLHRRVPGER